ncbi:MAG: sugar ABC transporter permease [Chloroflexota bacterium]|nr:sugar ABC transporter permease [Chloroflexota bacterium]MDP6757262.1 sugar ABC transporter permease [Chloroflexota bacterium]
MAIAEQAQKPRPVSTRSGVSTGVAGYLFITPSLIFIAIFVIGPIIGTLWYSLTSYDLMSSPRYIGLANFERIIDDDRFSRSMTNSLLFAFGTVPTGVVTSLLLAALINRQIRGIYAFRALFYMPVVSSFVSVSLIWLWMYEPQMGLLNDALEALGLPRLKWMRSAQTAMLSIIIMSVWKNMGLNMVIYLAGLQGVPPHLYESSEIDGAGRISQFLRITVPLLAPTTFFVVIVYFIGALQMFVQVFIMTQGQANTSEWGGPLDSTLTVVVLVYQNAFEYLKMGYASAVSFMLLLVAGVITIINARVLRYDIGW